MDLISQSQVLNLAPWQLIQSETEKFDLFTPTFENGVAGSRIGGTATYGSDLYTPAKLICGRVGVETDPTEWEAVTNGSFRLTLDGTLYNIDGIDFTGDLTMADVAATIQGKVNELTLAGFVCEWDETNERFIFTSGEDEADTSVVSFLTTSTGTVGTDISGAGASAWIAGTADYFAQEVPYIQSNGYFADPTDATLICVFNNVPSYVQTFQLDLLTPYYRGDGLNLLEYNIFDGINQNGRMSQKPGETISIPTVMRENMEGCILTINIPSGDDTVLVQGLKVTFG